MTIFMIRTTKSILAALALGILLNACKPSTQDNSRKQGESLPPKGSPAWLVEMFFKQKEFPNKLDYYTGDMKLLADKQTIGSVIPENYITTYRQLEYDSLHAIFAVNFRKESHQQDWYCYIKRDADTWKIQAVRCLALPPMVYVILDSLNRSTSLPDSLRTVRNSLGLLTLPDEFLKKHLHDHISQFTRLAMMGTKDSVASAKLCDTLHVLGCERPAEYRGCVFIHIGGVMRSTGGYIYAPDETTIPKMSPSSYIYIEQVVPHWYVYKTT